MQVKQHQTKLEYQQTSRTQHHNPFSATLQEQYSLEFQQWKMPAMKWIVKLEKDIMQAYKNNISSKWWNAIKIDISCTNETIHDYQALHKLTDQHINWKRKQESSM